MTGVEEICVYVTKEKGGQQCHHGEHQILTFLWNIPSPSGFILVYGNTCNYKIKSILELMQLGLSFGA